MNTDTKVNSGGDNIEPQRIGAFVVLEKLGEGGMGTVYKAHDPALDRTVALKSLPLHFASDAHFVARFKREAAAAAKFNHPNLVQVYAAGEDTGTHFIAMEYVEGESLQKRIEHKGRLGCREALVIAICVAEGLRYAWNKAQLIHRDIKPGNILISTEGEVKVADLGLVKMLQSATTDFTSTGTVMGSPRYISPEQGQGLKEIDFRSDIYCLGGTLYHMLTGCLPYESEGNVMAIVHKHIYEPPPDILHVWPECPAPLAKIVTQMLQKKPDDRFQSYDELIAALTSVVKSLSDAPSAMGRRSRITLYATVAVTVIVAVTAARWWGPWRIPSAVTTSGGIASAASLPQTLPQAVRLTVSKSTKKNLMSEGTSRSVQVQAGTETVVYTIEAQNRAAATFDALTIRWTFLVGPSLRLIEDQQEIKLSVGQRTALDTKPIDLKVTYHGKDKRGESVYGYVVEALQGVQLVGVESFPQDVRSRINDLRAKNDQPPLATPSTVVAAPTQPVQPAIAPRPTELPKPSPPPQVAAMTATTGTNPQKEKTIELGGGMAMEFVLVPAGSFMMGSDKKGNQKPVHKVTITKPFYIGKYEVTQEQWEKVMGHNPSGFKGAKNPVDSVNWDDCQEFIAKLKDKVTGHAFRLPTEAEWEYACRAGSTTYYYYGDNIDKVGDYAWFKDNSEKRTHPVGQKQPNAWGLYDMCGNVREWCEDVYHYTYEDAPTDGSAWTLGGTGDRVVRGGTWDVAPSNLSSTARSISKTDNRNEFSGLRVVAVVGTP